MFSIVVVDCCECLSAVSDLQIMLIRPLESNGVSWTLRLILKKENLWDTRGLITANWLELLQKETMSDLVVTLSQTKWKLMSRCLVLEWYTVLKGRYQVVAP